MEHGETERREGGGEGSALCMACGVMSMVMKTKDGREVRESERNLESRRVLRKTRIKIEIEIKRRARRPQK